ncbi:hypothetical protein HMPREF1052_0055 [Pasteurella bettyae CCUG 2042]|uniref:Uncharacterized protein n=1 Tax=Pasteurella bettyae CCUG 2042 TaxID=1095749 RepID=I3DI85_9PAST|nr:hypothetical protein HMPREF1052_0055 [Pasteurella bettyae CCUG 2042]
MRHFQLLLILRSHTGAWIETTSYRYASTGLPLRSHTGAWIETT